MTKDDVFHYRLIVLSLSIALTIGGLSVLHGICSLFVIIAAFVACLSVPLWVFILRPLAYFVGLVKPNAYNWEVIAWKHERTGKWEEALQAYDNALMLEPSNQIILAKRDLLIERLKLPDPYYFPPPEDLEQE